MTPASKICDCCEYGWRAFIRSVTHSWQSYAISNLHDHITRTTQCRAGNLRASVSIDHDRNDKIHRYISGLQQKERLWKLSRVPEFAYEREERDMACIREDNVRDAEESRRKANGSRCFKMQIGLWIDTHSYHGHEDSAADRDECCIV